MAVASCFLFFYLFFAIPPNAADDASALVSMQKRYASVETISGSFRLYYRDFGMEQVDSGIFWLKKPSLMKWEYEKPRGQLFVANGEESFLYVPQDNQVTVQPLNEADLRNSPLEFLLGSGDIRDDYLVASEPESEAKFGENHVLRLIPKRSDPDYAFFILEIDRETFDLRRLFMQEHTGSNLEYRFYDLKTDVTVGDEMFQFKIPPKTEVLRMEKAE
ncbi:MAG: outer membrane lipoprotein carrier protein LolA [Acidobacteriota bacterium]